MGTSTIAVGLGLLVFLSMEGYEWYRYGLRTATKHFRGSAGFGLLVTWVVWVGLFVFCAGKIVYDNHRSLVDANSQKLKTIQERDHTINTQKKTIQELETQRQELEAKLKEQPKVGFREKQTASSNEAELTKLRADAEQRERRKLIRSEIGKLLDEAVKLRRGFIVNEEKRDLLPSVDEWNSRTIKYLKSVESSYASRFTASPTSSVGYVGVPIFNNNMIAYLEAKIRTLSTILGEIHD